ncbi:MAG: hypothetical protein SFX73_09080 [Kofleriaceae bacterium]|nr:hypothetical protein [Kofleriaceae bacterium]
MRAAIAIALGVLAIGCSKSERDQPAPPRQGSGSAAPAVPDKIEGTLSVDGKPVAITGCRPGRATTTFVELLTAEGVLRFEDRQLFWQVDPKAVSRGEVLSCTKLDRSWGGGTRTDGSAYFRGLLRFECTGVRAISGDVTVDCGNITPTERGQLDANRQHMLDEQKQGSATRAN